MPTDKILKFCCLRLSDDILRYIDFRLSLGKKKGGGNNIFVLPPFLFKLNVFELGGFSVFGKVQA
jgi:hypothetical protein